MKIKGLLIDPDNETVGYVECEDNLQGIKEQLGCQYIGLVRTGESHHFYCDDDGHINGQHKKGFQSNLYGGVIAGKAIVFADEGGGGEANCTIDSYSVYVEWVDL